MHILFIPSWFITADDRVRGSFFRDQAMALIRAGHQVGLLVPPDRLRTRHGLRQTARNWRRASHDLQVEQDSGLTIYRIPWWGWGGSLLRSRRDALALTAFDRYCAEQGRPDIVHGHSLLYGGYLAAVIKAQRGIPAVATEHSSVYIHGPVWPDQKPAIRFTIAHLDRLTAVSDRLAESMGRYFFRSDVTVLPNIVDLDFFQPAQTPPASPFRLSLIARLDANKAPELALSAFARAFGQGNAHLTIAGKGPRRAGLVRLATTLHLQDRISFPGWLSREKLRELIQSSHCVVSTSRVETFGLTLIEAMACGKPVIATRSGGPDSFVTETTGLLVPTGDVDALAAAMRQMADTYDRYDPAAIRAYCVDRFSEAAFVRNVERLYSEVTGG